MAQSGSLLPLLDEEVDELEPQEGSRKARKTPALRHYSTSRKQQSSDTLLSKTCDGLRSPCYCQGQLDPHVWTSSLQHLRCDRTATLQLDKENFRSVPHIGQAAGFRGLPLVLTHEQSTVALDVVSYKA